jgi:hypothetical protein
MRNMRTLEHIPMRSGVAEMLCVLAQHIYMCVIHAAFESIRTVKAEVPILPILRFSQ